MKIDRNKPTETDRNKTDRIKAAKPAECKCQKSNRTKTPKHTETKRLKQSMPKGIIPGREKATGTRAQIGTGSKCHFSLDNTGMMMYGICMNKNQDGCGVARRTSRTRQKGRRDGNGSYRLNMSRECAATHEGNPVNRLGIAEV